MDMRTVILERTCADASPPELRPGGYYVLRGCRPVRIAPSAIMDVPTGINIRHVLDGFSLRLGTYRPTFEQTGCMVGVDMPTPSGHLGNVEVTLVNTSPNREVFIPSGYPIATVTIIRHVVVPLELEERRAPAPQSTSLLEDIRLPPSRQAPASPPPAYHEVVGGSQGQASVQDWGVSRNPTDDGWGVSQGGQYHESWDADSPLPQYSPFNPYEDEGWDGENEAQTEYSPFNHPEYEDWDGENEAQTGWEEGCWNTPDWDSEEVPASTPSEGNDSGCPQRDSPASPTPPPVEGVEGEGADADPVNIPS